MSAKNVKWEKIIDVCNVDFGTRVVRKKDGGSIYPVYGGGGETFKMDIFNRENCLVISRFAMSPQCTRFVKGKFFLNDSGLSLSSKDVHILSEDFLNTIILGLNDEIYALGRGTAQKNLNVEAFKELRIPVPPIDEQKRIVKVLDETFEKIEKIKANAQANLQNAKDLFEASLIKIFDNNDWQIKKIEDICTITSSKRIFKNEYVKKGIPFYRTKEIKELSHGEPISLELYISNDRYESIKKQFGVPQIGDVLISAVGTIGEILVIDNDDPFYFKDGNIIWMKDIKGIQPNFLKFLLTSVIEKVKAMTRGAAYNALTIEKFKKQEIPLPPLPIQKQIVAKLDSLSEKVKQLESNYKQVLADCDELKKAILKKAFNGNL